MSLQLYQFIYGFYKNKLWYVMKNISWSMNTLHTIFQCKNLHLITVKLSAINIADCRSVAYTKQHSKLTCKMLIAECKKCSALILWLCLCPYFIYIILGNWALKRMNTKTCHYQHTQFILAEFLTNWIYITAKLNKLIENIIYKESKKVIKIKLIIYTLT